MKLYTKQGDQGKTRLGNGSIVYKDDLIIKSIGSIDELNALLGLVHVQHLYVGSDFALIRKIQDELFCIGSEIAMSKMKYKGIEDDILFLENQIDKVSEQLEPLKNFILPGGSQVSAWFHFARTVCRRAERDFVEMFKYHHGEVNERIIVYLNRLSDLLFALARFHNSCGKNDVIWPGST